MGDTAMNWMTVAKKSRMVKVEPESSSISIGVFLVVKALDISSSSSPFLL
jgi:hypothetical protein